MARLDSIESCPMFPAVAGAEFRHCAGFLGYAVSSDGRLWSCKGSKRHTRPWRPVKVHPTRLGYTQYKLRRDDGRLVTCKVHQLVCAAFHGPCPSGLETRHDNGVRDDNRADNLLWGTHSDNVKDAVAHGTWQRYGESNANCKLTDEQVRWIRSVHKIRPKVATQAQIAAMFGVSKNHVSKIVRGIYRG